MRKSLLSSSRTWHRRLASILFVFFFVIACTGIMLGWKFLFTKTILDNKKVKAENSFKKWLPLNSLETMSVTILNRETNNHFTHSESIQLRPAKGYINFVFKKGYNVQLDGGTGVPIHIEQKNGGIIQDIHDGAILDNWIGNSSGVAKAAYSTAMGLSFLFLILSGIYLWYKPKQIKEKRKAPDLKNVPALEVTTS